ncbi:MAG: alpha-galactosidase [Clostridia bacterium]|nr:alpha-galactosidase [Clostridia bacterium]
MEYVSSGIIKGIVAEGGKIKSSYLINRLTGNKIERSGAEFGLSYFKGRRAAGRKAFFDSSDMQVDSIDDAGIELSIAHGGAAWRVRIDYVADDVSGVLRKYIKVKCSNPDIVIDYMQLDSLSVDGIDFVWSIPKVLKRVLIPAYITTMGQPYYVGDIFLGGEFPMADNRVESDIAYSRYYIGRPFSQAAGGEEYCCVPFVMGAGREGDFHSMRDSFFRYIDTISAQPVKFRIQFNSWYDNMLDINKDNIAQSFKSIASGFADAGLRPLDCYVVDDGWTDYKKAEFWAFDRDKFSNGFEETGRLTKELGSTFGVWFGPRGGYTSQTVKYAALLNKIGYYNCRQSRDICTGNPEYIKALCERMARFCIDYNVSYFKIDGFAYTPCKSSKHGHPKGKGDGLYFYTFLWEEWTKGFKRIREVCPNVFLNVTSYAHCSPWFLKWCDAVWLNNCSDMGYAGKGDNLSQCLNYRDGRYRDFFEVRQLQFPVSNLYNHEPCYAYRNCNPPMTSSTQMPGAAHPTVEYTIDEFKTYMYMCMMRGTGFVELYFTPHMFDSERYKAASEVLKWTEDNFDIIKHSVFFGDAPESGGVYGYYAFNDGRGILAVRNSGDSDAVCAFDHKALSFNSGAYEISRFYPQSEEDKVIVDNGKILDIPLKPFEVKLYNISLI